MKCGDARAHANEKAPELAAEVLPATHKNALEMSTGKVQTIRWTCACEWARYEVDVPETGAPEKQLGFAFGTPGCAAGRCP